MTANHRALDDTDIELIEHVKCTPSLYNPRNPDFRLAYRKEQDWERVAQTVGMTSMDARKRWTCLRDRYSRELKQLRLHPDKGEYGKNEFFRLMDFLRRFVRKRRERRRNLLQTGSNKLYESSWDGSMDGNKLLAIKANMQTDKEDEVEEEIHSDEEHVCEEDEQTEHDYLGKIESNQAESVGYPEFVEVDTAETYSEYEPMEQQQQHRVTSTASPSVKPLTGTVIPIMLPQTSTTTYTLATTQQIPTDVQHQDQQTRQPTQSPATRLQIPQSQLVACETTNETEDDYFCKSIAAYLRQLSRRHKIKAKVEMFQILEKYIELEESAAIGCTVEHKD